MASTRLSLSIIGAEDWRKLSRNLRGKANRDFRSQLRKRIADAGRPIVDEVKNAVINLPITGEGGGGTAQRRRYNSARAAGRARAAGKDISKAAARGARKKAGLRRTVAGAVKLQITAKGIRIYVDSKNLPENQRTLPRHLDSAKGWRRPTFGHSPWVHQQGKPYFASTISRKAPQFRAAILEAMEDAKRDIES